MLEGGLHLMHREGERVGRVGEGEEREGEEDVLSKDGQFRPTPSQGRVLTDLIAQLNRFVIVK